MEGKYIIAVDFGGTKIATAIFNSNMSVVSKIKVDSEAAKGKEHTITLILDSIRQVMKLSGVAAEQLAGVGVSSLGPLNLSKGVILYPATLGWKNVPIRQLIYDEFKAPVFLENDCNAGAYGELLLGAGRGSDNLIYITVSTGIGGGIIIDKKIYQGKNGASGEFGHICIEDDGRKCLCGNFGCLEAYASGTAIVAIAKEYLSKQKDSILLELSNNNPDNIDCFMIEKAAYLGDIPSVQIWENAGQKLGHGISILLQLLDPNVIIIGGGVTKAWSLFYLPMLNAIKKHTYMSTYDDVSIVRAQLGQESCLFGAAMIAAKEIGFPSSI